MDQLAKLKEERAHAQCQKRSAVEQIKEINRRILTPVDKELSEIGEQIQKLEDELAALKQKPRVSDHAVVRFLERKYGFDFEQVRSELLTDNVKQAMAAGARSVKQGGMTLRLENQCVVTVI